MKAYRHINQFFAPGTQPKGAEKIDIPTDSHGLVGWVNDLVNTIWADATTKPRMVAEALRQEREDTITREPDPQVLKITDEAFEALPLAYQLHLAALALENARNKVK